MKVNPVARAVVDAQLAYAFADRFDISKVAEREPTDADLNAGSRLFVAEFAKPVCEEVGLADLDHVLTIVHMDGSGQPA
jgi:hypothetical protein